MGPFVHRLLVMGQDSVMTRARRRQFRHYLISAAIGVLAAVTFAYVNNATAWDYLSAVLAPVLITLGVFLVEHKFAPRFARLPFAASFGSQLASFVMVIVAAFYLAILVSKLIERATHPFDPQLHFDTFSTLRGPAMASALQWAFAVLAVIIAHRELSRKLGPNVLRNWVLGRYHRPRQEHRVFMFLDLNDSTTLAETLGDLRFSELVRDFFADITPAIIETRGEVSHFIGDEAVITWQMRYGIQDANCVRCFFLAKQEIDRQRAYYLERFGQVPQFKAGLHSGTVVVTEIGTMKSEIVFHGDVLNTTARIQSSCKSAGAQLLVSNSLMALLRLPIGLESLALGDFKLKGKESALGLLAIRECIAAPKP